MKLLVFGATGRTGILLVQQALERGHHVTAFVRNPRKLILEHPRLGMLKGDIYREASVVNSMEDEYDCVMNLLGVPFGGKEQVCTISTQHVLAGMKEHGPKRLIVLGGAGMGRSMEKMSGLTRWFTNMYIKYADKFAAMDKENQFRLLQHSDADYTVVAAPWLTNGKHTGIYRHGTELRLNLFNRISRADVADFMIKVAEEGLYVREEPFICY